MTDWWTDEELIDDMDRLLIDSYGNVVRLMNNLSRHANSTPQWGFIFISGQFVHFYNMGRNDSGLSPHEAFTFAAGQIMNNPAMQVIIAEALANGGLT